MVCVAGWSSLARTSFAILALVVATVASAIADGPEIRTGKDTYAPAEKIEVIFENGPGNKTDWITVVPSGTPDGKVRVYRYLSGKKQGSLTFPGLKAGEYEARFHLNNTHAEPAARHAFRVGDPPALSAPDQSAASPETFAAPNGPTSNEIPSTADPTIAAEKTVFAPEESIRASFKQVPGHTHDWIAVAKKGAAAQQYLEMAYLRGATAGERTFKGLPAGEYELRLFLKGGIDVAARYSFTVAAVAPQQQSAGSGAGPTLRTEKDVFAPTEKITVHFENLTGDADDWIAIRKRDEGPRSGAPFQSVRGKTSGSVTIGTLAQPGAYEARLYLNKKYEMAASYAFSVSAVSLFVPPAVDDTKVGLLGKAKDLAHQCQVLHEWTERVDREYPELKKASAAHPRYPIWVGNLFRDDEYVPVFGRTYSETDDAASAQIISLVRLCQSTVKGDTREMFRRYWNWYAAAFAAAFAREKKEAFTERARRVREIQAWIASVTEEVQTLNPTDEGFARIVEIYEAISPETTVEIYGGEKVALIWPRESSALLGELQIRKSALALAYAREKIAAYPAELASIERIDETLTLARTHVVDADKDAFIALGPLADERRLEIYHAAITGLSPEPESLGTLDGILADAASYELAARYPESFAEIVRLGADFRERTYRSAIEKEFAALPAMPERLVSITEIESRKQFLRDLLKADAERLGLGPYEAAAEERKKAVFAGALSHFSAELKALPVSLEGAKAVSKHLEDTVGAAPGLPSALNEPFAKEASARAAAIYDSLIAKATNDLRNKVGKWRQSGPLIKAARAEADQFADTPAAARALSLVSLAIQRANEWAQSDFSSFQSEVASIGDGWEGLRQLDGLDAEISGMGARISAFAAYTQETGLKREQIIAALEEDALASMASTGATYKDLETIVQTGSALAARFEEAGLASSVPAIDEATASRVSGVIEGTYGQFVQELAAMQPTYESVAVLEEQAAEFALLAVHVAPFLSYEKATHARIAEVQDALCAQYIGELGITEAEAQQVILGPDGGLEFRELACRARVNGHQVSAIERESEPGQARIKVMQADGEFMHIKLHDAEARPGEVMLVGYAAGDANSQSEISVNDWEGHVAWLIRESSHGVPDTDGVTACDRAAADPADPAKVSNGVADADLDAESAIEACAAAVEYDENEPRLRFQFARALNAAGAVDQARSILEQLAGNGYAAAAGYLGDLLAGNEAVSDEEWQRAMTYYRQAAEGGYQPAAETLAALDQVAAGASGGDIQGGAGSSASLSQPALIDALRSGDFAALSAYDRYAVKTYLFQLAAGFSQVCFSGTTKRLGNMIIVSETGGGDMSMEEFAARGLKSFGNQLREMTNPGKMFSDLAVEQSNVDTAAADAMQLSTTLGCDSPEMHSFISNAIAYYQGRS